MFLEDCEAVRTELGGRITVAANDYHAFFEVSSCAGVYDQYDASMRLLEWGLKMARKDFLELKSQLGVRWEESEGLATKRHIEEDTSQATVPDSKGNVGARTGIKRARVQEPTPELQQGADQSSALFADLSRPDKQTMAQFLFPADGMIRNASQTAVIRPRLPGSFQPSRQSDERGMECGCNLSNTCIQYRECSSAASDSVLVTDKEGEMR